MRLFRYFDANGGILTLRNRQLLLANPLKFNDPFEITPRVQPPDDELIVEKLSSEMWVKHHFENRGRAKGLNEQQSREDYLTNELPIQIEKAVAAKHERAAEARLKMVADCAKHFRILCCTLNHESILMWSHYAERHHGLVLEFETEQLLPTNVSGLFHDVRYRTSPPLISGLSRDESAAIAEMEDAMTTKSICWGYEEEVRMLFPLKQELENGKALYLGFNPACIKRVIVGCYDHPTVHTYQQIEALAEQAEYKHVHFQRAYIHPHDYKLNFADRPPLTPS